MIEKVWVLPGEILTGNFSELSTENTDEEMLSLDMSTVIEPLFETVTLRLLACPTTTSPKSTVPGETTSEPDVAAAMPDPQPVIAIIRQTIGSEKDPTRKMLLLFLFRAQKIKKPTGLQGEEPHVLIVTVYLFTLRTYRKQRGQKNSKYI